MNRKFLFCVIFSIALLLSTSVNAIERITWISSENTFVTVKEGAVIYEYPYYFKYSPSFVNSNRKNRTAIIYDDYKQKTIKKQKQLQVRGYANRTPQLSYDTYVVEVSKKLYFLPMSYVQDNSILQDVNDSMTSLYNTMLANESLVKSEIDSLVAVYMLECNQKVMYYERLKETLPAKIDSLENAIHLQFEAYEQAEYDKWYKSLPASTKAAAKKISIVSAALQSPNSVGGCDYYFEYTNNSNKTIKYLHWTGSFYNAVNDQVYCEIRRTSSYTGKDTGPVAPGEVGGGYWECVVYNWSAETLRISNVTITYMDGSTVSIAGADIRRLIDYVYDYESADEFIDKYGSEYETVNKAVTPYKQELSNCDYQIRQWKSRISYLEDGKFLYVPLHEEEYISQFKKLNSLYQTREDLKLQITIFEKENMIKQLWER